MNFAHLSEALAIRRRYVRHAERRAAILVPLIDDQGPPRILLTRRTESLSTHKGQVAFPGGLVEAQDRDVEETALRESEEEIGLPRDRVEILGRLDDMLTVTGDMIVTPIIGRVRRLPPLVANPSEVARVFTIPLAALREGADWTTRSWSTRKGPVPVYYFDYDGEVLWGLSAYVTLQLLDLTEAGPPFPIADYRGDL